MMIDIVSPGTYTYGSLVLGGVLRDKGHDVKVTSKLQSRSGTVLLSLYSTLQLLDPKIREFVAARENVYVGGPVSLCPEMVLGELNAKAVVTGEGEDIVAELVEKGPEGLAGVSYRNDGEIIKSPTQPVNPWTMSFL